MIKLKVSFNDNMGAGPDTTEEVTIPSDVCLYCCHDRRLNIDRLHDEVTKALIYKGYDFTNSYFELLKVYII